MALISPETFIALVKKRDTLVKKFSRYKTSSLAGVIKLIEAYNEALIADNIPKATQYGIRLEGAIRDLPEAKRKKYREALDYVVGRVRGRTKKSDLAIKKNVTSGSVTFHGNFIKVGGEGLTQEELNEAISYLRLIDELVAELAATNFGPRKHWFGTTQGVGDALKNMRNYLRERCVRITFIRLEVGARCDGRAVKESLAGRVIPTTVLKGQKESHFRRLGAEVNVASGLRLFLGPVYFTGSESDVVDDVLKTVAAFRFMTIFHEMTHKIINTSDHCYDLKDTEKLVTDEPAKCIDNADTWGYFLAHSALSTGRLPGLENTRTDIGVQMRVRRRLMGYDDD